MSNELHKRGTFVSASGVRLIWLRHGLANFKRRLTALPRIVDAPALELQVNPPIGHREITRSASAFIVTVAAAVATVGTYRRFFRRVRVMIRAWWSPKTPSSVALATKPDIENSSRTVRGYFMDYPVMEMKHVLG
ncbi:MAG: hypothetical protein IDH49_11750 [Gammaproteobacteria bacterium]|nr:hypothetical protein [Gammaproteobacteria bacterium]